MDANRCAIELHKLIERFEADVAIYCMTMTLGQLLADQAEDQEHGARLVEKAMSLLAERVMSMWMCVINSVPIIDELGGSAAAHNAR